MRKTVARIILVGHQSEIYIAFSSNLHGNTGELQVDWDGDFWADHDEECHGRIADLEDEYPEGFKWSCCDELGNEEGCEVGKHVPNHHASVR